MVATQETIDKVKEVSQSYKYGFVTNLKAEKAPLGLNEDIVKWLNGIGATEGNNKEQGTYVVEKAFVG